MIKSENNTVEVIRDLLATVNDPEIPVINILELGIVRDIQLREREVTVTVTPTYSGCPAMKMIEDDIRHVLSENGFSKIEIKTVFAPAWTTDWISSDTKAKIKKYGIAPPTHTSQSQLIQIDIPQIECPQCNSRNTELKSQFGSTACKSYYFCHSCRQAFEYFKPF